MKLAEALRERDEAREDASHWKIEYEIVEARLCGEKHDRDNGIVSEREIIPKLERERDEWRKKFELSVDAVEIAARLARAESERDEARAERDSLRLDAQREAEHHDRMVGELEKVYKERDEAREAIPAGEWVAYEDHQKFHDAASRLLVAINKQLPIGCFTLISSEYYRLQNAIYGREGAK
jgi:hypothetical protein